MPNKITKSLVHFIPLLWFYLEFSGEVEAFEEKFDQVVLFGGRLFVCEFVSFDFFLFFDQIDDNLSFVFQSGDIDVSFSVNDLPKVLISV